jgi:hypothetical protein
VRAASRRLRCKTGDLFASVLGKRPARVDVGADGVAVVDQEESISRNPFPRPRCVLSGDFREAGLDTL